MRIISIEYLIITIINHFAINNNSLTNENDEQ
jgi:hypothetical protein